jgi:hypothetical protein
MGSHDDSERFPTICKKEKKTWVLVLDHADDLNLAPKSELAS